MAYHVDNTRVGNTLNYKFQESSVEHFTTTDFEKAVRVGNTLNYKFQESSVEHFTTTDFEKAVKRKKHSLIMFYAPWCGHCKKAKPEFTGAAEQLADNNKVFCGTSFILETTL